MSESVSSWPNVSHSGLSGMLILIPFFGKEFWNYDERKDLLARIPSQQLSEACPKFAIHINISLLSYDSKKRKHRDCEKQIAMDIICPLGMACSQHQFWSTNALINSFQGSVLSWLCKEKQQHNTHTNTGARAHTHTHIIIIITIICGALSYWGYCSQWGKHSLCPSETYGHLINQL